MLYRYAPKSIYICKQFFALNILSGVSERKRESEREKKEKEKGERENLRLLLHISVITISIYLLLVLFTCQFAQEVALLLHRLQQCLY